MVGLECKYCHKSFLVSPSRVSKRKFCSVDCKAEYQKTLPAWNKGKKRTWDSGSFEKGHAPWNKGVNGYHLRKTENKENYIRKQCGFCEKEIWVLKSRVSNNWGNFCSRKCKTDFASGVPSKITGTKYSFEVRKKMSAARQGMDIDYWGGFITSDSRRERGQFRNSVSRAVLERDNYTCQLCEKRGGDLHVDHIQPWAEYVELRFDINNCRTLCVDCHYLITFGKKKPIDSTWGKYYEGKIKV